MTINAVAADWRDKAVEFAVAKKQVHEALWSQPISFWVSMDDDGSNRSGFAEYLYFVSSDAGRPDGEFIAITVWDRASMAGNSHKQLGKANCTFQR